MSHSTPSAEESAIQAADRSAIASSVPTAVEGERRLRRTAGIAALTAGLAYALQPVLVFLLTPTDVDPRTVDGLIALRWQAPVQIAVFITIGVAMLFLAVSTHRLMARAQERTTSVTVTTLLGVVAAAGWLGAAAGTIQHKGLGLSNLEANVSNTELQNALLQAAEFGGGILSLMLIATAGWLTGLALTGRRVGLFGWPLTIVTGVGAAVIAVPALALLLPFGILVLLPVLITLGIAFLWQSRAR